MKPAASMRTTNFHVTHRETGERFRWSFWRDQRTPACWFLRTSDDCVRALEPTWADSAPRIQQIAENYGCECRVS